MKVGFGKSNITPRGGKTAIAGSLEMRYTDVVYTEVWTTCFVMYSKEIKSIWVCADMCHPTKRLFNDVYEALKVQEPELRKEQLILSTTHSTAYYYVTDDEFCDVGIKSECNESLPLEEARRQICDGIVKAYLMATENLCDCIAKFSVSDFTTGFCRRTVYKDNKAIMYGNPYSEKFLRMEYPDGGEMFFIYFDDKDTGKPVGIFSAVPCPAQADEGSAYITADYWHTVRERIYSEYGNDICVFSCCRAAGELSPHKIINENRKCIRDTFGSEVAEKLGNNIADEIIKRKNNCLYSVDLSEISHKHVNVDIDFPIAQASEKEKEREQAFFENLSNFDEYGNPKDIYKHMFYSYIKKINDIDQRLYRATTSIVKIGKIVFYTAPCELFAEYAKRISVCFRDTLIVDVQLTNDCFGYLPTKEAIEHGGYSTDKFSTITDDVGGEIFVKRIVELIKKIFG